MKNAHKRLEAFLMSTKTGHKECWSQTKEYNLIFHYKETDERAIMLDQAKFKGIEKNEFIEIVFPNNKEITLIFQFDKFQNLVKPKNKENVSMISSFIDLIIDNYNFKPNSVFVKVPSKETYYLDEVSLVFNEKDISKEEINLLVKRMINNAIYQSQDIKMMNKEKEKEIVVGSVGKLKNKNNQKTLTGIPTYSTHFGISSISFDLVFMIEISKNTFDTNVLGYRKYETIINYFRCIFDKIRNEEPYKQISIVFYGRIYYETLLKEEEINNFNKSCLYDKEYFIDFYSKVELISIPPVADSDFVQKLLTLFTKFRSLHEKTTTLASFLPSIQNEYKFCFSLSSNNHFTDISSLPKDFFDNLISYRFSQSFTSNVFEAARYITKEIYNEASPIGRYGTLVNILLSGGYFPYYSRNYALKIKQMLDKSISLSFTILDEQKKYELMKNHLQTYKNNDDGTFTSFFMIDDFSHLPLEWCNVYCASFFSLRDELKRINGKYLKYRNDDIDVNYTAVRDVSEIAYCFDDDFMNLKIEDVETKEDSKEEEVENIDNVIEQYSIKRKNQIDVELLDKYDEDRRNKNYNSNNSTTLPTANNVDSFYEILHYNVTLE